MNSEVKQSLGQQRAQNELNDGMEVGLAIFDRATGELTYAGAGTSLYVVSSGALTEIKGMKCSVGSIQEHVKSPPPTHAVQVKSGDMFYMSSDGIPDQFGGPDGKKFQKESMKKMLEEISSKEIAAQKSVIADRVAAWMKGHQQTDDMLLLGVRV
jgi:serine phosphatase RsbU (regulator of sigma subunit)